MEDDGPHCVSRSLSLDIARMASLDHTQQAGVPRATSDAAGHLSAEVRGAPRAGRPPPLRPHAALARAAGRPPRASSHPQPAPAVPVLIPNPRTQPRLLPQNPPPKALALIRGEVTTERKQLLYSMSLRRCARGGARTRRSGRRNARNSAPLQRGARPGGALTDAGWCGVAGCPRCHRLSTRSRVAPAAAFHTV